MDSEAIGVDALPTYGKAPSRPGLYLGLLHGRDDPRQQMDDWGFNGPTIGPLRWFHTTYACTLRIAFASESDGQRYFGVRQTEHFLQLDRDLLVFNGQYFGDWTVYYVAPEDCERPPDAFRNSHRRVNHWAHSRSQM